MSNVKVRQHSLAAQALRAHSTTNSHSGVVRCLEKIELLQVRNAEQVAIRVAEYAAVYGQLIEAKEKHLEVLAAVRLAGLQSHEDLKALKAEIVSENQARNLMRSVHIEMLRKGLADPEGSDERADARALAKFIGEVAADEEKAAVAADALEAVEEEVSDQLQGKEPLAAVASPSKTAVSTHAGVAFSGGIALSSSPSSDTVEEEEEGDGHDNHVRPQSHGGPCIPMGTPPSLKQANEEVEKVVKKRLHEKEMDWIAQDLIDHEKKDGWSINKRAKWLSEHLDRGNWAYVHFDTLKKMRTLRLEGKRQRSFHSRGGRWKESVFSDESLVELATFLVEDEKTWGESKMVQMIKAAATKTALARGFNGDVHLSPQQISDAKQVINGLSFSTHKAQWSTTYRDNAVYSLRSAIAAAAAEDAAFNGAVPEFDVTAEQAKAHPVSNHLRVNTDAFTISYQLNDQSGTSTHRY
jgi:hypothetical protein